MNGLTDIGPTYEGLFASYQVWREPGDARWRWGVWVGSIRGLAVNHNGRPVFGGRSWSSADAERRAAVCRGDLERALLTWRHPATEPRE